MDIVFTRKFSCKVLIVGITLLFSGIKSSFAADWYAYISGNWTNPAVWTTDPSGNLFTNLSNQIPQATDNVFILDGRNVTLNVDGIQAASINVTGILTVGNTNGHNLSIIRGNGIIRFSGKDGLDNFPAGTMTGPGGFADANFGGTVEVLGTGLTLNVARTYNNLKIRLNVLANVALLKSNLNINGEFAVERGTFQINDTNGGGGNQYTINAFGNVTVFNNGSTLNGRITLGTGNATHLFNFFGNLVNQGNINFTNRVAPDFNNAANNGIVIANFISETQDQTVSCLGPINFYRIRIDKQDPALELLIEATSLANFNIFGPTNQGHGENANIDNQNALALNSGTVRIGSNVVIPRLNNGGNYNINENARLWVDGGSASKNDGTAIVIYGEIKITNGLINADIGSGFTTRDNGLIVIEGGTVNLRALRTSVLGSGNIGGFIQSGGVLNVTGGGGVSTDYYLFSLTFPGNTFEMTGGEINITGTSGNNTNRGAIFIASLPENQNVTGGTIRIITNNQHGTRITSTAPFYNLILENTHNGTQNDAKHRIQGGTSGPGAAQTTLGAQPLVVLNDLILRSGTNRTTGGNTYSTFLDLCPAGACQNLSVGRNLTIEDNTVLDIWSGEANNANSSTVTFNGNENSVLFIGDVTTYDVALTGYIDPEGEQVYRRWEFPFPSLIVNKPGASLSLQAKLPAIGVEPNSGNLATFKTGAGGKNIRNWATNLVKVVNQFRLENGMLDQMDSRNITFVEPVNGLTYNVGYSLRLNTNNVFLNGDLFTYEDGVSPKNANVRFRLNSGTIELQSTDIATIGNVRINLNGIPGGDILNLNSNLYIKRMEFRHGKINLRNHRLKIDVLDINLLEGGGQVNTAAGSIPVFDSNNLFRTSGNASDGGLALKWPRQVNTNYPEYGTNNNGYNQPNLLWFPVGPDATRLNMGIVYFHDDPNTFSDEGYLILNLAQKQLQTANLPASSGDMLNLYWRVRFEGFSNIKPTITHVFQYQDSQVGGSEANYVPGYVLDNVPYTRGAEGVTNIKTGGTAGNNGQIQGNDPRNVVVFTGSNLPSVPGAIRFVNNDGTFNWTGFPGTGFELRTANYTAGRAAAFVGAPAVYYSRMSNGASWYDLNWQDGNNWSTVPHDGANNNGARPAAGSWPQAGDIAVIGYGGFTGGISPQHSINILNANNINVAEIIFANPVNNSSRLVVNQQATLTFGSIGGTGGTFMERPSNPANLATISGDFGEFYQSNNFTYNYFLNGNGTYNITPPTNEFPNLRVEGGNNSRIAIFQTDIIVNNNLTADGNAVIRTNNGPNGDIFVHGALRIGGYLGGNFQFNNGTERTVNVNDLRFVGNDNTSNLTVLNNVTNGLRHKLIVRGNIVQERPGVFDLFNGNGVNDNNAELILSGVGNNNYTKTDGGLADFYRIVMDKGSSVAESFTFNENFTLGGATTGVLKALELKNGVAILNNSGINFSLSTGGDFIIPGTSGIQINLGTVNLSGANAGIQLDGLIRVNGGQALFDGGTNNFIQYSASGNATIEVNGGLLRVGSQVRRGTASTAGILRYTQSAGQVLVGTTSATVADRGMFEVLNPGSRFNMTGGELVIVRQNTASPERPALRLEPAIGNVTGGVIRLGNANTPAAQNNFQLASFIALHQLRMDGANNPTFNLASTQLIVNNLFSVASANTFNANGFNLTIRGDFATNGTFNTNGTLVNNQTTFFTGNNPQLISGNGTINFFNLNKNSASVLTTQNNLVVQNNLSLLLGSIDTDDFALEVKRNVILDGLVESNIPVGIGGLVMSGTVKQFLSRSEAGQGEIGTFSVNNPAGVEVVDGQGYSFLIQDKLVLADGVFQIGGNLLTIAAGALIENGAGNSGVLDFNNTRMVRTNSSFTDSGLRRNFAAIGSATNLVFPIGQQEYTPLLLEVASSSAGSLTLRSADEIHPAIVEKDNAPDPEIVDRENVLEYHWVLKSNNVANMVANAYFYYDPSMIQVAAPYTVNNYIPARILDASTSWDKAYSRDDFEQANNRIRFQLNNLGDANISGDYLAGVSVDNNDDLINGAIPDQVPVYDANGDGLYTSASTWTPANVDTPPATEGVGPLGAIIRIPAGTNVTLNDNNVRLLRTEIQEGAILTVDNTLGHRLGNVSGTGTIRIVGNGINAPLPAGQYENFLTCDGGGLEYTGTGSYSVLVGIPTLRRVTFSGSNERNLPNNDIQICEDFEILGDVSVINNFELAFRVRGNVYKSDASSINWGTIGGRTFILNGSTPQSVAGDFTAGNAFYNLQFNNPAGINLVNGADAVRGIAANGDLVVSNNLNLVSGIVQTNNDNELIMLQSATLNGGSATAYINGPFARWLGMSSSTFEFPIGDGGRFGRTAIINTTGYTGVNPKKWVARYFNASATGFGYNTANFLFAEPGPRNVVSDNEFWRILHDDAGAANARVRLRWDSDSDVDSNNLGTAAVYNQLRVMVWSAANNRWESRTTSNSGPGVNGTISTTAGVAFSENQFTIGALDSDNNALPVEYGDINVRAVGRIVHVYWSTLSERNSHYFEVQRSYDGRNFEVLKIVEAAGHSDERVNYAIEDDRAMTGIVYYRLNQVDFDGTNELSDIYSVMVMGEGMSIEFVAYPNPFYKGESLKVRIFDAGNQTKLQIRVIDMAGRVVFEAPIDADNLADEYEIPFDSNLRSGIYILRIEGESKRTYQRVMLK